MSAGGARGGKVEAGSWSVLFRNLAASLAACVIALDCFSARAADATERVVLTYRLLEDDLDVRSSMLQSQKFWDRVMLSMSATEPDSRF